MSDSVFTSGRQKMDEVATLVSEDLSSIQTGRARPALVEGIKVEAYAGSFMEVRELAGTTVPDAHSIVIKPWDPSTLEAIEKGLLKSDLQISPVVDGDLIRISIPALTQERRQELVKMVKQKIEAGKAMLRQVRIEVKKEVDKQKDQAGVSEDDVHGMYDRLKELMDEYNKKLEDMEGSKEKELMSL